MKQVSAGLYKLILCVAATICALATASPIARAQSPQQRVLLPLVMGSGSSAINPATLALFTGAGVAAGCVNTPQNLRSPLKDALVQPALRNNLWQMEVMRAGLQSISGKLLRDAGANSFDEVQVWRGGALVLLDFADENGNGLIDVNDAIYFYTDSVGDRWNRSSRYWLAISNGAGARMEIGAQPIASGTALGTAWERGEWRERAIYNSRYEGPQLDYWHAQSLNLTAKTTAQTNFKLTRDLPAAPGSIQLMVDLVADSYARPFGITYTLSVNSGPLHTEKYVSGHSSVTMTLPGNAMMAQLDWATPETARLWLQSAHWLRPVYLAFFDGAHGFETASGSARYHVDAPAGSRLFDVTDPTQPSRVALSDGDFDSAGDRRYVLAVADGATPVTLQRFSAFDDMASAANAQALYIGPAAWRETLGPLLAHRASSGTSAAFISLESIYDWFSDGDVSPEAIRSYLRYARATGAKFGGVVLVGDANFDPFNQQGLDLCRTIDVAGGCTTSRDLGGANILPPYMARIDVFVGEVACDTCYVRFDCDVVIQDKLPDAIIGRLPVSNTTQLAMVVKKIIAYEAAQVVDDWKRTQFYFSDDADLAGDFAKMSDDIAALQPADVKPVRAYYVPKAKGPAQGFFNDVSAINDAVKTSFARGAGIIQYRGHGFANGWGHPLLFSTDDIATLSPSAHLPVVLEFACGTNQYASPQGSGPGLDERLFVQPNGAIAVWGSAGEDESAAYALLTRGFYGRLWNGSVPMREKTLGSLAQAGYIQLLALHPGASMLNSLGAYALLGDPFTVLNVSGGPLQ